LFPTDAAAEALREALPVRFHLAVAPTDTPHQVRAKERALAALTARDTTLSRWKRVADLWCARWFSRAAAPPSSFTTLADAVLAGRSALPPAIASRYLSEAERTAATHRFFHFELEFPEVFFDAAGGRLPAPGFDAVVGNPPWDMVRADSGSADDRPQSREQAASLVRFTRDSGVYAAQSVGHANRYQLFLDRAIALARSGGRLGMVLPSGVAVDHGSAPLRRLLFSRCEVDGLVGFDNRHGLFPIHRSTRFVLLTATNGSPTREFGCRLGESDPSVLETADIEGDGSSGGWFSVSLSPPLLERLSGAVLTVPDLRGPLDLSIAEHAAARFAPLGSRGGWQVRFGRELNLTEDRPSLSTPGRGLPVVEGRQIEPFRVRLDGSRFSLSEQLARRLLGHRHERPRVGYRDVASATNRLTLIAGVLPAGCVSTHTVFCLRTPLGARAQYFLCGLFNSFVVNYLVRMRVITHVTTAIVERLPIPRLDQAGPAFQQIAAAARVLARREEPALLARLNAAVAHVYGLTSTEFQHVLDTFRLIPVEERDAAMRAFR
jgi:hypothetical protein